jgi:putative component of membrane protein insertase Oxa1/YidC/SpoIIIJ protein YidD
VLHRPGTTVSTAVTWLLVAEGLGIAIGFFASSLFDELALLYRFPARPPAWQFYSCGGVIACVACLKRWLVMVIELYQRYAPEETRRKCTLMPSCSEYAILALYKHGVIVGLYKTHVRLTRACRGGEYRVDYP